MNQNNNLIYYYIFGDNDYYYKLLKISIISLLIFGKYDGDILIISDVNIDKKLLNDIDYYNFKFMVVDINSYNKLFGKFYIYNYIDINYYDKVMFLDLDTIIQNNINVIFKSINNDIFNFSFEKKEVVYD
jgi:alpha-N-acetylglucosamine transferase